MIWNALAGSAAAAVQGAEDETAEHSTDERHLGEAQEWDRLAVDGEGHRRRGRRRSS